MFSPYSLTEENKSNIISEKAHLIWFIYLLIYMEASNE